jgi:Glycosyltransferase family 20
MPGYSYSRRHEPGLLGVYRFADKSQGITMVSEFAGAAESLDGCVLLNPWDVDSVADVIYQALQREDETRIANFRKLHRYTEKYTSLANSGAGRLSGHRRVRRRRLSPAMNPRALGLGEKLLKLEAVL